MKRGLNPFALLMLLGVVLVAPLLVGCVAVGSAGVVADPTPLQAEEEEDEEGQEGQGGG